MLTLCGVDNVIRNVYRIGMIGAAGSGLETTDELRSRYLDFLQARQPKMPVNRSDDVFVIDSGTEEKLGAAFSQGALDDMGQSKIVGSSYPPEVRARKIDRARLALNELMDLNEDLSLVFSLIIHSVFVRASQPTSSSRGSHGGSSSASIGAIWLTLEDSVRSNDIMEMFVHELTHHLLFVDELNNAQFDYAEIAKPENFAHSAILKRNRPLDKVVHSVVVATEILAARENYLPNRGASTIHPASDALRAETEVAINSVLALPNLSTLVTPHIRRIIEKCADTCYAGR